MLNEMIPAVDEAIGSVLNQIRANPNYENRSEFCQSVAGYYNSLITDIQANSGALYFDGTLNPQSLNFIVFFIENSDIPEIWKNSVNYDKWLPFFLSIVKDLYLMKDKTTDGKKMAEDSFLVQLYEPYLFETNLLKATIRCMRFSMTWEREEQVKSLISVVLDIDRTCNNIQLHEV